MINVQLNDTGNYICEVTVGYKISKQEHAIEVQGNKTTYNMIYVIAITAVAHNLIELISLNCIL